MPLFSKPRFTDEVNIPCNPIKVSPYERQNRELSPVTIAVGAELFNANGYVIVENAVSHAAIDKLGARMLHDLQKTLQRPNAVFNQGNEKNNLSQAPPLSPEYIDEDIWANPFAAGIMSEVLGGTPILRMATSNISLPTKVSTARQAVHSDAYADIFPYTYCIELAICLGDVSAYNGSTELWPASHNCDPFQNHIHEGRGYITKPSIIRRAQHSPPIQPTIPKGSICIRDVRIWHAGMPNLSPEPRIMVGLAYFAPSYPCPMYIELPESARSHVEQWKQVDLVSGTKFRSEEIDYLCLQGPGTASPLNFTRYTNMAMGNWRAMFDRLLKRDAGIRLPVTEDNYWAP